MKKGIRSLSALFLSLFLLAGCGEDKEMVLFRENIESFCIDISNIDSEINNIDTSSGDYTNELLSALDRLDAEFQNFAELDFPEEYDYLEQTADEAGEYMTEAVKSFHDAYTNESLTEETFTAKYKYARENYSRAYKRIQIIITFLHGEEPASAVTEE